jgi:NADH-quinone oxidoreductase subunit H
MVLHVLSFLAKVIFMIWLQMLIRWTLPRFRYDQVMDLCWKILLPLSLANIFVTGLVMLWLQGIS